MYEEEEVSGKAVPEDRLTEVEKKLKALQEKPTFWKTIREWAGIFLGLFGALLAFWSFQNGKRNEEADRRREADQLLYQAWDLLGGEEGSEIITHFESNPAKQELARRKIEEAIRIDPKYANVYRRMGGYFFAKSDWVQALEQFQKAIDLDPKGAVHYYNRASVWNRLGSINFSIVDYARAIKLDPRLARFIQKRGIVYIPLELPDELLNGLTLKSHGHSNLYDMHGNLWEWVDTLQSFQEFEQVTFQSGPNLVFRARQNLLTGDLEAALLDYNQEIELNPSNGSAFFHRGLTYQMQGNLEAALADYNKAIELNPQHGALFFYRGQLYLLKGDLKAGMKDLSLATELNPLYITNLGKYFLKPVYLDFAVKDFEKAIQLDPLLEEAHHDLKQIKEELGKD